MSSILERPLAYPVPRQMLGYQYISQAHRFVDGGWYEGRHLKTANSETRPYRFSAGPTPGAGTFTEVQLKGETPVATGFSAPQTEFRITRVSDEISARYILAQERHEAYLSQKEAMGRLMLAIAAVKDKAAAESAPAPYAQPQLPPETESTRKRGGPVPPNSYQDGKWYRGHPKTDDVPHGLPYRYTAGTSKGKGTFQLGAFQDLRLVTAGMKEFEGQFTMVEAISEAFAYNMVHEEYTAVRKAHDHRHSEVAWLKTLLETYLPDALPMARARYPGHF